MGCLIRGIILANQLLSRLISLRILRKGALQDRRRHPRAHLIPIPRQRKQRRARPKDVGSRGMRITLGRIEEQIAHPRTGDMLLFRRHIGEDNTARYGLAGPGFCCATKVEV